MTASEPASEQSQSQKALNRQGRKKDKEDKQKRRNPKPIQARTPRQKEYIRSLLSNELTFAVGPAGVGKTYVPARIYSELLLKREIDKLYVARPNVSKAKHRMGFLPGDEREKTAPWLVPIMQGVRDSMSPSEFDRMQREGKIETVPYEFIQGRTMQNAAWIVDEAENLDLDDLYITLTRQGENLRMAICGDIYQARISDSGLAKVVEMAQAPEMNDIGIVSFDEDDIVRSAQAKQWAKAFRDHRTLNFPQIHANDQGIDNLPLFITGKS